MQPAIDRKWATIIGIVVFVAGFIFLPMNKYRNMMMLRREYPSAARELVENYDSYTLQKENLEKIQVSLDKSVDINSVRRIFPEGLSIRVDEKKHMIYIEGSVSPNDVNKLIDVVTTTSNMRFEKLHIENPVAIPITVFPLNMVNSIYVYGVIEYVEVKP